MCGEKPSSDVVIRSSSEYITGVQNFVQIRPLGASRQMGEV